MSWQRTDVEATAETGEQGWNQYVDNLRLIEIIFPHMKMEKKSFSTFCPSRGPVMLSYSLAKLHNCREGSHLQRDEKVSTSYLNDTGNANLNRGVRHQESQFPSRPFFITYQCHLYKWLRWRLPKPPTVSPLQTQNPSDCLLDDTWIQNPQIWLYVTDQTTTCLLHLQLIGRHGSQSSGTRQQAVHGHEEDLPGFFQKSKVIEPVGETAGRDKRREQL